jgi:hypothetical protein
VAFSIEHTQSRAHNFLNCSAQYRIVGISQGRPPVGTQTSYGGTFKWFGGTFLHNTYDVVIGTALELIVVNSATSEASKYFISSLSGTYNPWSILIEGVDWSNNASNVYPDPSPDGTDPDGVPYWAPCAIGSMGPVTIRNSSFVYYLDKNPGPPSTYGRVRIGYAPNFLLAPAATLRVESCEFSGDTPNHDPVAIWNDDVPQPDRIPGCAGQQPRHRREQLPHLRRPPRPLVGVGDPGQPPDQCPPGRGPLPRDRQSPQPPGVRGQRHLEDRRPLVAPRGGPT